MSTNRSSSKSRGAETRARILEVALDLFNTQGYDKTSLREIAEKLGITKAALYYYFSRKEDILLALHARIHDLGQDVVSQLGQIDVSGNDMAGWITVLDRLVDEVIANRKLFALHVRNGNSIEELHHNEEYQQAHASMGIDAQEQIRRLLGDKRLPNQLRIRMVCSLGAVLGTLIGASDIFDDISGRELAGEVRAAVRDLFAPLP